MSLESSAGDPPALANLFLLLWCGFLRRSFLGRSLLLGVPLGGLGLVMVFVLVFFRVRRSLLHLGFFLRQLGSLEALPVKSNLGDAHRGIGLPVSTQLLVLLLALVMEDQNLGAATFLDQLPDNPRSRLWLADLSLAA